MTERLEHDQRGHRRHSDRDRQAAEDARLRAEPAKQALDDREHEDRRARCAQATTGRMECHSRELEETTVSRTSTAAGISWTRALAPVPAAVSPVPVAPAGVAAVVASA